MAGLRLFSACLGFELTQGVGSNGYASCLRPDEPCAGFVVAVLHGGHNASGIIGFGRRGDVDEQACGGVDVAGRNGPVDLFECSGLRFFIAVLIVDLILGAAQRGEHPCGDPAP